MGIEGDGGCRGGYSPSTSHTALPYTSHTMTMHAETTEECKGNKDASVRTEDTVRNAGENENKTNETQREQSCKGYQVGPTNKGDRSVAVEVARENPPTATHQQMESMHVSLPALPKSLGEAGNWKYQIQEYTYARMVSPAPWDAGSQEADFEKDLQFLPSEDIIQRIAAFMLDEQWNRVEPEEGSRLSISVINHPHEGWEIAAMIHHLVIQPTDNQWRLRLGKEYLRQGPEHMKKRAEAKAELRTRLRGGSNRNELDHVQRVEKYINEAEKQGRVTLFSRKVLLAWHRTTVAKVKTRRQKRDDTAKQKSSGAMPEAATKKTNSSATAPTEPLARLWSGRASKVWFVKGQEILCFVRSDSRPGKPQLDTFGGNMEEADQMSFVNCARRELSEEVRLERSWLNAAEHAYEMNPNGHAHYTLKCTLKQGRYQGKTVLVTHWFVSIPPPSKPVELTEEGRRESMVGTLQWRTAKSVFENLNQFEFLKPVAQDFLGLVLACEDKANRFDQVAALPTRTEGKTVALTQELPARAKQRKVTLYSRKVLMAWRQVTAKKRAERIREVRDGAKSRTGMPMRASPLTAAGRTPSELPALARLSAAATEELSQVAAAIAEPSRTGTDCPGVERRNEQLIDRVTAEARRLAMQKGSALVHFRDIRQSAEKLDRQFNTKPTVSPATEQPVHIDEVVESLTALNAETLRLSRGGKAPPRVLVVGETGSTESPPAVAKMFKDAGADVATCDLKESSYGDIPHYQGEAANVQDLGWDLVICHPPCTYLSNAGVSWLKDDPNRWQQLRHNASVFRMQYDAQAPFLAAENAKMHQHARQLLGGLRPSQYVHPWQHGHGHTKPTGLFLKNLPLLEPSKEVTGREKVLANISQSTSRAEKRSRTYTGIAAAMAIQWMPVLQRFCQDPTSPRGCRTVDQMIAKAQEEPTRRVQAIFVRKSGIHGIQVLTYNGLVPTREVPKGTSPLEVAIELANEKWIPTPWSDALKTETQDFPDGNRCFYQAPDPKSRFYKSAPSTTRVWVVAVSEKDNQGVVLSPQAGMSWLPVAKIKTPWPMEAPESAVVQRYLSQVESLARTFESSSMFHVMTASSTTDPHMEMSHRQPWMVDYDDLPPPSPTPRHIRRRHGKWQVWTVAQSTRRDENKEELVGDEEERRAVPSYGWQALPLPLANALNAHLGLPFKPMKTTPEETSQTESLSPKLKKKAKAVTSDSQSIVGALVDIGQSPSAWMKAQGGRDNPPLTEGSKLLWANRPPLKKNRGTGLGAMAEGLERGSSDDEDWPYQYPSDPKKYRKCMKKGYRSFVRGHPQFLTGPEPEDPATVCLTETPTGEAFPQTSQADECYEEWLRVCSLGSPDPELASGAMRVEDPDSIMNQDLDVARTPSVEAYAASSLYVADFQVARRAQTRNTADTYYTVGTAVAGRVLADTGAAPSIITTGLLEKLPLDCRLSRDPWAVVGPLSGPDGRPLVTMGRVKIEFRLGETRCQHEFAVVQGKPLVLLGNDFLVPRNAEILLNTDGVGNGHITLTSVTKRGITLKHSFDVSSNARRSSPARAVIPKTSQDVAIIGIDPDVGKSEPQANGGAREVRRERWIPEPQKPDELTTEALEEGTWRLETSEHLLYTDEAVEIPPRSRITIRVRAPQQLIEQGGVPSCMVDRLRQLEHQSEQDYARFAPPVVSRLATVQDGYVEVQLVNTSDQKKAVAGLAPLAMLDSEYYVRGCFDPAKMTPTEEDPDPIARLTEAQVKILDQVVVDPANRLSDEKKARVRRLLAANISAFATDPKNPTKTHLLEVELPLKADAAPHRHAASRVGEEGRQIIEKHIEEMESRGIIRKSNSAWGSRVVLVTKKDGSIRFCVDYRDLNAKLLIQDSPIPLTVEALDRLSSGEGCTSSLFLSTLDLASGFWTLPIKESHKTLTAFVTHRQKYEFNYLPFGIQSGPSYMVRLMDAALQGLAWETCMPYLDDVGVWSTGMGNNLQEREDASFEQMMTRLQAVFERLRWAGLSMKANKCILFGIEAEYLGHVVSREGLKMDPKKIEAVKNWSATDVNTVTRVKSFLGLCSYYRRFIEGFSLIAAPLTDLTRSGVDVEVESQTPRCQRAIHLLIRAITSEPVMSTPRFDRAFIVKTDAANKEGLGGVLSQLDNEGREKVVAYHGRRLNKAERNYMVTEIELLAAVDSIKHWRAYLWGRTFKLVVDHVALKWLHTMRDTMEGGPSSRLMRWIIKLSEYRFFVEHKPGILHKDADAMSRLTTAEPKESSCKTESVAAVAAQEKRPGHTTARSRQADARIRQTTAQVQMNYLDTKAPTLKQLRAEQEADPECTEIVDYLHGNLDDVADNDDLKRLAKLVRTATSGTHNQKKAVNAPRDVGGADLKVIRRLAVFDGVLYRSTHLSGGEPDKENTPNHPPEGMQWVPYVPTKLRSALITAFHDRMGHASRDRVKGALQKRYYWPKMGQDIEDHVAECHECTLAKYPNTRGRDPVGPPVGRYPFDILYTDVLDLADTHDYTPEGAGYRKLVVFADSLSRWVEAVPVHKEPTAAEFMAIYHEHVVARYGVPRKIVSDRGSNLVAQLNAEITRLTGTDLRGTAAEHKEANGVVERFNQTLQNMVRASDEGGASWKDHLPFLLMAYRATPHRVTRESPAMILFGRELRLPAQIGQTDPPPSTLLSKGVSKEVKEYATRLHNRMVYAWRAAYEASREAQGEQVSDTSAHTLRGWKTYQIGDRVVRRLYDPANALANKYAGPYRVVDELGKGRYRLQDLENKLTYDEFDVSNLRPYRTHTDEEELTPDEYIVEKLLDRRMTNGKASYLVKYLGYPRSQAEWTTRTELERRCDQLLEEYDAAWPLRKKRPKAQANASGEAPTQPVEESDTAQQSTSEQPDSHLPDRARFSMGSWSYGRPIKTRKPKGLKVVWKDASHFTTQELNSEKFELMREQARMEAEKDQDVAGVFRQAVEHHGAVLMPGPLLELGPAPVVEEEEDNRASRMWFVTNEDAMCFFPTDDDPEKPRLDTFGGSMDAADSDSYADCVIRNLKEQAELPELWVLAMKRAVELDSQGKACIKVKTHGQHTKNKTAIWVVRLTDLEAKEVPTLTMSGKARVEPDSMIWRTHGEVLSNLSSFERTNQPLITVMKRELLSLALQ